MKHPQIEMCKIIFDGNKSQNQGRLRRPRSNNVMHIPKLYKHNTSVKIHCMNSKQLKKWLEQQGATFQTGKGSHLKVFLNGKQSSLPMHGTTELGKGLEAAIKRQLGLK